MDAGAWECPRGFPALRFDEVHVWRASLSGQLAGIDRLDALLDAQERGRAARFRAPRARDRFIVARALLRELLGRYASIAPERVAFAYGERGKPALASCGATPLEFNVSHSGDVALFAFARGRRVGVDVEALAAGVAHEDIPERFFTAREAALLRALPRERQPEAFFDCWVRKEAALKAWGTGLALALDAFEVLPASETAELECPREAAGLPRRWWMRALDAGAGYRAAVVVEGPACALRRLACPGEAFRLAG